MGFGAIETIVERRAASNVRFGGAGVPPALSERRQLDGSRTLLQGASGVLRGL
jgi:hypothetical protein